MFTFNNQPELDAEQKVKTVRSILDIFKDSINSVPTPEIIGKNIDMMLTNMPLKQVVFAENDTEIGKIIAGNDLVESIIAFEDGVEFPSKFFDGKTVSIKDFNRAMLRRMYDKYLNVVIVRTSEAAEMYEEYYA